MPTCTGAHTHTLGRTTITRVGGGGTVMPCPKGSTRYNYYIIQASKQAMASTTENREAPQEIQEQEVEVDEESKQKLSDRIAKEAARLKDLKLVPLVLSVKNYGVVRHNNSLINRIEVDTGFDFGLIKQIMYSEPVPCDWKPGFNYVHLILLAETASTTAMSHPILIPYIYPTTLLPDPDTTNTKSSSSSSGSTKPIKNDLKEWLLVNAKGARVRHSVNEFH